MPQGMGTYGSKVGRPKSKKKVVKKKGVRKPSAQLTRDQFLAKQAKTNKKKK